MGDGRELEEAPMVEHLTDHTIKPKKVKKVTNDKKHLREPVTVLDQGNALRNRDEEVNEQGNKMTKKKKRNIRQAKRQHRDAQLASKPIAEDDRGIKLGDSVVEVHDRTLDEDKMDTVQTSEYVEQAPETGVQFPGEEIPVGHQYVAKGSGAYTQKHDMMESLHLFPVFDYDVVERFAVNDAVLNIEHSSASTAESHFKPIKTPFNQNTASRMDDLGERSAMKASVFHNHKSIASELGKYEGLIENQSRQAYIREMNSRPAQRMPQYGQEFLMQTPQRGGPPTFIRSINGQSVGYNQVPSEIEQ